MPDDAELIDDCRRILRGGDQDVSLLVDRAAQARARTPAGLAAQAELLALILGADEDKDPDVVQQLAARIRDAAVALSDREQAARVVLDRVPDALPAAGDEQ